MFTIQAWCDNSFHLLANAPARIDANRVAHLDVNGPSSKTTRRGIMGTPGKKGVPDELQRNQNFYKFTTGEYVAISK